MSTNISILDDEDSDIEIVPLTSQNMFSRSSSILSSTPSLSELPRIHNNRKNNNANNNIRIMIYKEFIISFCIFIIAWWLPRYLISIETTLQTKQPPYQTISNGDIIILDFTLNEPLIEPPTIPSNFLVWASVWIPLLFVAIFTRKSYPLLYISALLTSIGICECITQTLKLLIQRRRPNFYALCGFSMETKQCTASLADIRESQFSFPSGHSSLSCGTMTFLSWLIIAHIIHDNNNNNLCRNNLNNKRIYCLLTVLILLGWSIYIGTTRIIDHWHHPSDVIAGLLLGGVCGTIIYHIYFPPIWITYIPWSILLLSTT